MFKYSNSDWLHYAIQNLIFRVKIRKCDSWNRWNGTSSVYSKSYVLLWAYYIMAQKSDICTVYHCICSNCDKLALMRRFRMLLGQCANQTPDLKCMQKVRTIQSFVLLSKSHLKFFGPNMWKLAFHIIGAACLRFIYNENPLIFLTDCFQAYRQFANKTI